MSEWYSADWKPGIAGAGAYRPRGTGVELIGGGPLDGRRGHVHDAGESLWVASANGDFVVRSARTVPVHVPEGWHLVGHYSFESSHGALVWEAAENLAVGAPARLRAPFAAQWASRASGGRFPCRLWQHMTRLLREMTSR